MFAELGDMMLMMSFIPNIIVAVGVAEREGQPIPLGRFFRVCFGVTMVHLLISTLYLYFSYNLL